MNIRQIDIYASCIEDFFSKYNYNSLNEELDRYINNESLGIEKKESILIKIHTKFELGKEEKEQIVKVIRSNYGMSISDNIELKKQEDIKRLVLFIIGVLAVVISEVLEPTKLLITSDIFLIIGWGAIWESVYSMLFTTSKRKHTINRLKKIVDSKIEFTN